MNMRCAPKACGILNRVSLFLALSVKRQLWDSAATDLCSVQLISQELLNHFKLGNGSFFH